MGRPIFRGSNSTGSRVTREIPRLSHACDNRLAKPEAAVKKACAAPADKRQLTRPTTDAREWVGRGTHQQPTNEAASGAGCSCADGVMAWRRNLAQAQSSHGDWRDQRSPETGAQAVGAGARQNKMPADQPADGQATRPPRCHTRVTTA